MGAHPETLSADNPHRLTDAPALQTIETPSHTESPATESGPEHIFIALLKHEWMRGDTVKRDGGDVLLLPPIIPKITRRDEVLQK